MITQRRLWIVTLVLAVIATIAGLGQLPSASAQTRPATVHPMTANTITGTAPYVPLTPVRAIDSTTGLRIAHRALAAGSSTAVQLAGYNGIPPVGTAHAGGGPYAGVSAIAVNLTIVAPARAGTATLYASGTTRPSAATVSYAAGRTTAVQTIVPVGSPDGQQTLYTTAAANVRIDVEGYFGSNGTSYHPVTPTRLLDTRSPAHRLAANGVKTVIVAGHAGVPSSNVAAVVLNLGAVNPSAHGYLEAYPTGSGRPSGSPLTFPASGTLQGMAVVPMGTGGGVNVFSSAATDLTVDVIGWIPSHTTYTPLASRAIYNVGYSSLTTNISVAAQLGIAPSQLAAVQLTIGTTSPSTGASLSVGPYSNAGFPTMLSFAAGQTVSNSATVAVNQTNGVISIRSSSHTRFVVYLSGYFRTAPTTAQVTAGNEFGCALSTAGTVKCWGADEHGQLGNGHTNTSANPIPHQIAGLTGVTDVSAGGTHACVVTSAGTVKCWGDDQFGQVGTGGTAGSVVLPVTVTGISHVTQVAAGLAATCALTEAGTVWCWGSNYAGQSGPAHVGTLVTRPQQVTGVSGAVQVTTGGIQSCALLASGTVKCWGDNYGGAVGGSNHSVIVGVTTVPGLSNAVEASAGDHTTCAALANQTVKCWGGNDLAQLGNGHTNTPAFVDTATTVPGLTGVTDVETHYNHVCAVTTAETLTCWGLNGSDQIGVPWSTANPVTRPRAVAGVSAAAAVATGGGQTLAVLDSGAVIGWGDNSAGELAGPTRGFFPTPVDILGL